MPRLASAARRQRGASSRLDGVSRSPDLSASRQQNYRTVITADRLIAAPAQTFPGRVETALSAVSMTLLRF